MIHNDEYFMRQALYQAKRAFKVGEMPVGCVIVHKNKIIAEAHNLKETTTDPTAHAEILAIKKASNFLSKWRLNDCDLYVTLEPCAMCASAIVQARIKKVVIGTLDNKKGAVVSSKHIFENNHNHNLIVKTRVLCQESKALIKDFLNLKR